MFNMKKLGLAAAAATFAVVGAARADEVTVVTTDDTAVYGLLAAKEAPISKVGAMLSVGGGVTNFTENGPQALTNPGAAWDIRATLGSRSLIGVEAAYTGSLQDLEASGLDNSAMLSSHGVEGDLRINAPVTIGDGLISPYGFGGLGYKRYGLAFDNGNTSSSQIAPHDDVMLIPFGVGLAAGIAGVTVDTRATYRQTFFTELVGDSQSSFDSTSLNSWEVGAGLGFEF
jgi:hypothetical protein